MATKVTLDKSKLVRNLANRFKLVPHLDKQIGVTDFEWTYEYEPKGVDRAWHPSSHCTPSLYELYHIGKTDPYLEENQDKISTSLYKTFQVGHFWHQYLQHLLLNEMGFCERVNIERKGEVEWNENGKETRNIYPMAPSPENVINYNAWHYVSGSADVAPCEIPDHGPYLVDFKTQKSMDFKMKEPPAWCADKWECQVNIYMDFFGLDKALIIGIQKDSPHDFKEFEYHRNQDLVDAIYDKWKLASACLREDIEPPEDEVIELPLTGTVKQ